MRSAMGRRFTYPDRPYMHWQFEYEDQAGVERDGLQDRNNPETFLEGAESLHGMFRKVREFRDVEGADNGREWGQIADLVKEIIERPGRKGERVGYWQEAAGSGDLYEGPGEPIPNYEDHDWNEQRENLAEELANSSTVFQRPVFQFHQAAAAHRVYVLRDLLPGYGLLGN